MPADEQHRGLPSSGRNGEHRHVERALPVRAPLWAKSASGRRTNLSCSACSCANDLTTWTPTTFSSATVATSAIFCCTSRSTGCETFE